MSTSKVINSSPDSAKGIVYQFWVALEKCAELDPGEKLLIETEGDLTIPDKEQLELKYIDHNKALTQGSEEIWKTLRNWMDDSFAQQNYKSLILRTTQDHGTESSFKTWNDLAIDDRLAIINNVASAAEVRFSKSQEANPPEVLRHMRNVIDPAKSERLKQVAAKFHIAIRAPDLRGTYQRLRKRLCWNIPEMNEDAYLSQLVAYIIHPDVVGSEQWEITHTQFKQLCVDTAERHRLGLRYFPTRHRSPKHAPLTPEQEASRGSLFVCKIQDIDYAERVPEAIKDYTYAQRTIFDEFQRYSPDSDAYQLFEEDVERAFEQSRSIASRRAERCSKTFFDQVTSSPPPAFQGFLDSRQDFRNGVLHSHMNDESKTHQWNLNA